MAADFGCDGVHGLEVAHFDAEGVADRRAGLGTADKQEPPGFYTVLHLCFDAVEEKFSKGLERSIADLADIFYPQTIGEDIDSKVAEHLALVSEKARIAALSWLEWDNIVADEALQPFHAIVAGDADLAAM